ncbi:MAG: ATPase [Proteobacteria bacterium]|nr:MAG: ATPase [Pseudomonadota bacterium]PIE64193.1 MAG: ATPase [Desulfobacterales bacterium]
MKATQIIKALKKLTIIQQPVFLWGPPGVGKSQVVRQAADQRGTSLIDIRAVLLDPVDLRGLPRISADGLSEWCVPSFFPKDGQGILFLDELNAAPPLVQAACYQLVLDRRLGEYVLPEGWTVVAAGNRETDRSVTHRMPSALANRFVHIDFDVDLDEWSAWAVLHKIVPEIVAFLRFRPALLHDFDPEKSGKAFASPRSWEFASRIVEACDDFELLSELLVGTVGKGAATEICGFMRIWKELPAVEDIMTKPLEVEISTDPAVLYAVCEMVGRAATLDCGDSVLDFAGRLPAEFSVLLVREAVRHCNDLALTDSFARWAEGNAGLLV